MVRFMRDASESGTYNQELANPRFSELTKNTHICGAGCGLGYLSLACAPPYSSAKDPVIQRTVKSACDSGNSQKDML